ncbi:MAG: hypothetical protein KGH63_00720 [Candidatus Micrarchaeota archaeon]|nr:hypothetical protein [Candidatus Micrarchaeota archaeon]
MKFVVEGEMFIKKKWLKFVKELPAASASRAKELAYNKIGSDHHISRTCVKIVNVSEMKA